MYKIKDGRIEDICFDGEACAISTSATSIMIQNLIGKTKEEAQEILDNYEAMLDERPYNKDILEDLNAYDEIYKQPNRKKCALLPFESLRKIIGKM
ncbi:MAG: iron-sulfur cluster assembly scaffold protein, partial [Bacilli bacterium]|nr:iron-sulfur cluster assembly scaffold protein [Bacilli bacterium]